MSWPWTDYCLLRPSAGSQVANPISWKLLLGILSEVGGAAPCLGLKCKFLTKDFFAQQQRGPGGVLVCRKTVTGHSGYPASEVESAFGSIVGVNTFEQQSSCRKSLCPYYAVASQDLYSGPES